MSSSSRIVTSAKKVASDRLPEWASEGAGLLDWLEKGGRLDDIGVRLKIQREGGYVGLDLVLFLVFLLTARLRGGIKGFWESAWSHVARLGALGGRKRLPAPASVSRILAAVGTEHSDDLAEWLLFDACEAAALMRHPAAAARDAVGETWHVFDLDPTVTVLRQRALPELDDLPRAARRSVDAKPGYAGRKRGNVQLSRMSLQHAGSSLWMGLWMAPGNGEFREHAKAAVQRVAAICARIDHPASRALMRFDGAGGNVPSIAACEEAGVPYLTRWHQYELLDRPEIRVHLNAARWFEVRGSGSGPRREAADLGWMELRPSAGVFQSDGSQYAPVRSRIVVSRFLHAGKKRGAGTVIDGWQYELYATDLPILSWPAADIATTYYGRCGQENRFYQEDCDIGLDNIFSYDIAGQQLANLVGLFIWNLKVCRGFTLAKLPRTIPVQASRTSTSHQSDVVLAIDPASTLVEMPPETSPDALNGALRVEPPSADIGSIRDIQPAVETARLQWESSPTPAESRASLRSALNGLDWATALDGLEGWRWDPEAGLVCPNNQLQYLHSVKVHGLDRKRNVIFRANGCTRCPLRAGCTASESRNFRKETVIAVLTETAYPIHQLLAKLRGHEPPPRPGATVTERAVRPRRPRPRIAHTPTPAPAWEAPTGEAGAFAVTPAFLLPARLREHFRRAHRGLEVSVRIELPRVTPKNRFVALTDAERQSRRLTWTQRMRWNAIPDQGRVSVVFAGDVAEALLATGRRKSLDECRT